VRILATLLLLFSTSAWAAFPAVGNSGSGTDTDCTSVTATLPTGEVAGDTFILMFGYADETSGGFSTPTDWTQLASADGIAVYWKEAVGSDSDPTSTGPGTDRCGWLVYLITGADDPDTSPPEINTVGVFTSSTPSPILHTPSAGADDYLWIAFFNAFDGRREHSTPGLPTGFGNKITFRTTGGKLPGCLGGGATRELNATSLDVGNFGISASSLWHAHTLTITQAVVTGRTRRVF